MMVEPDLEVPGTTASTWKSPINRAVFTLISFSDVQVGVLFLLSVSYTHLTLPTNREV